MTAKPKLLLLDEPLSALEKNLRQKMQHELKPLQRELGIGFVFVTHDQDEALTMSDSVAVLAHDQINQLREPEMFDAKPRNLFAARFPGESDLLPVTVEGGAEQPLETMENDKHRSRRRNQIGLGLGRLKDRRPMAPPHDRCPKDFLSTIALFMPG